MILLWCRERHATAMAQLCVNTSIALVWLCNEMQSVPEYKIKLSLQLNISFLVSSLCKIITIIKKLYKTAQSMNCLKCDGDTLTLKVWTSEGFCCCYCLLLLFLRKQLQIYSRENEQVKNHRDLFLPLLRFSLFITACEISYAIKLNARTFLGSHVLISTLKYFSISVSDYEIFLNSASRRIQRRPWQVLDEESEGTSPFFAQCLVIWCQLMMQCLFFSMVCLSCGLSLIGQAGSGEGLQICFQRVDWANHLCRGSHLSGPLPKE